MGNLLVVSTAPDPASVELGVVLAELVRTLDRHMARDFPHPRPPDGQLAVLRLVRDNDGITVRQVAESLMVHPNNVSTLVSQMTSGGLLVREQDPADRRVAHLHLTAEARTRIDEADAQVGSYLADALTRLDRADADVVRRAVPALAALRRAIG